MGGDLSKRYLADHPIIYHDHATCLSRVKGKPTQCKGAHLTICIYKILQVSPHTTQPRSGKKPSKTYSSGYVVSLHNWVFLVVALEIAQLYFGAIGIFVCSLSSSVEPLWQRRSTDGDLSEEFDAKWMRSVDLRAYQDAFWGVRIYFFCLWSLLYRYMNKNIIMKTYIKYTTVSYRSLTKLNRFAYQ